MVKKALDKTQSGNYNIYIGEDKGMGTTMTVKDLRDWLDKNKNFDDEELVVYLPKGGDYSTASISNVGISPTGKLALISDDNYIMGFGYPEDSEEYNEEFNSFRDCEDEDAADRVEDYANKGKALCGELVNLLSAILDEVE